MSGHKHGDNMYILATGYLEAEKESRVRQEGELRTGDRLDII
jgi:hypothetical protein